jgi:hypothetical protein
LYKDPRINAITRESMLFVGQAVQAIINNDTSQWNVLYRSKLPLPSATHVPATVNYLFDHVLAGSSSSNNNNNDNNNDDMISLEHWQQLVTQFQPSDQAAYATNQPGRTARIATWSAPAYCPEWQLLLSCFGMFGYWYHNWPMRVPPMTPPKEPD